MRRVGIALLWITFPLPMALGRFPRTQAILFAIQAGVASMILAHVTR